VSPSASSSAQAEDWSRRGSAAVDARDLDTAKKCFKRAAQLDRGSAERRCNLAIVLEALEEFGDAAEELTEALRIDPHHSQAARRLSSLLSRRILPESTRLNPQGLRAALQHDAVSRDAVADAAFRHLSHGEWLGDALALGRLEGWEVAARGLCLKRTGRLLRDELLLELLRTGVVRSTDLERLLTALRRALVLEVPRQRLADGELIQFATALMQQCWVNEFVWVASEEEPRAVAEQPIAIPELLDGNVEQGNRFLLASLYRPITETLGQNVSSERIANIQPSALRVAIARRVEEHVDEQARMARIPRLGSIADETSRKVALQYESAPYPRWTRLGMSMREGGFRRSVGQYFKPEQLAFTRQPFEVLVAGCGTGMDAIQVALGYGTNAQVLALDLSAASLAYASRMADHFGAKNITFVQADIGEIGGLSEFRSRFRIIECGGVLHHMADPFQGWRALIQCLAPQGLMRISLYSAIARRNLAALRGDPAYPGAGCDDTKLRAFRRVLMDRSHGQLGSELKSSPDFYTTSGFRDLALHVSERCLSIPEIANFLDEAGLAFRGFQPDLFFDLLQQQYQGESRPGSLERWAELELAIPMLFAGMYKFWCQKT
jgi:SAM-dependent methyltransferase/tetratricopeptide (TPR) repeat protein